RHMSIGELCDLAFESSATSEKNQRIRAAIVAQRTYSLLERAKWIRDTLKKHEGESPSFYQSENRFAVLAIGQTVPVGFGILIPGQGSQFLKMAERLAARHEWARDLVNLMDDIYMRRYGEKLSKIIFRNTDRARDEQEILEWRRRLEHADVTSAAVCLASTISIEYLRRLGIIPKVVCGHSLGELTAFYAASAMTVEELFCLAVDRGSALQAASETQAGAMLSVACTLEEAYSLSENLVEYAVIANINSPQQIVFSGSREGVDEIEKRASLRKFHTVRLPVATAFHSKLVEEGARILAKCDYMDRSVENLSVQVVSSAQGLTAEHGMNLLSHFCRQLTHPVDFVNAVLKVCSKVDYMIEAGPGRILSGIVPQIIDKNICYPVLSGEDSSCELNALLALAFVHGLDIDWNVLYHNRLIRPYTPFDKVEFIKNPCERNYSGDGALPNPMETPLFGLQQVSEAPGNTTESNGCENGEKAEEEDPDDKYALEDALERRNSNEFSESDGERLEITRDEIEQTVISKIVEVTGFSRDIIKPESNLLNDLHLDSIKIYDTGVQSVMALGVKPRIQNHKRHAETVADLIDLVESIVMQQNGSEDDIGDEGGSGYESWVRPYVREYVAQPLTEKSDHGSFWRERKVLILHEAVDQELCDELEEKLLAFEASVVKAVFSGEEDLSEDFDHRIVVMPSESSGLPLDKIAISNMIRRLHMGALGTKGISLKSGTSIAFVQFGQGTFAEKGFDFNLDGCNAASFARSLYLERRDLIIRILDFSPMLGKSFIAEKIIDETASGEAHYQSVGYTGERQRVVPKTRLQHPDELVPRNIAWTKDDVFLVTGGAKGITAECTLAIAAFTRAKFALVGSSRIPEDADPNNNEILRNLRRFHDIEIDARYYCCDICDAEQLHALVSTIESEMGNIRALLHGAGINQPGRLENVTREKALNEVCPKLLGAINLFQAPYTKPLKLILAMTSLTGAIGLQGNAWYGFANESLHLLTRCYQREHPETQVQSYAYSIWNDVGMGHKLGSLQTLKMMGIGAISVEDGVRQFMNLFKYRNEDHTQTIISSRVIKIPTWPFLYEVPVAGLPFVQDVKFVMPEMEAIVRVKLDPEKDLYLGDHIHNGTCIFPTVMGLEAMAEVAMLAAGSACTTISEICDIELNNAIVIPLPRESRIEIRAIVVEWSPQSTKVQASIRSDMDGYNTDFFRAAIVFGKRRDVLYHPVPKNEKLDFIPSRDFYGPVLTHGPLFHVLDRVLSVERNKIYVGSQSKSSAIDCSEGFLESKGDLVIGDPYYRDGLMQTLLILSMRYNI
ncbi:MAG: SDR family NAD(P)-dependent oxidoreductase, partial [Oligoflexales bacterium]|nr:SDR family NAD(P)-dependent oxidoreductase [Oligoflexales bacterium]